jgi:hypothetical protein
MEDSNIPDRLTDWKARSHRRYDLEFPVLMKIQNGAWATESEGVTKNLSVGGLLVRSVVLLPQHASVRFTLIMHGKNAVRPVHILGAGEVVRVTTSDADGAVLIAVRCNTPLVQLEEHIPENC